MLIFTLLRTALMVSFSGTAFISSFSRALASCCRVSSSTACTAAKQTDLMLKALLLRPAGGFAGWHRHHAAKATSTRLHSKMDLASVPKRLLHLQACVLQLFKHLHSLQLFEHLHSLQLF